MIDSEFAKRFVKNWITAFNSHNLDIIFDLYDDDFVMESPYIRERMGVEDGVLRGKESVRPYWEKSLSLSPPLEFKLISVFVGVSSIVVYYENVGRKLVCELFEFNDDKKVISGSSHHVC